jgi:hypothetical protein
MFLIMPASHALRAIQRLDPRKDNQRIVFLSGWLDFPLDVGALSVILLLRTFSVPRISRLLDANREWYENGPERVRSVAHAMAQLNAWGYDSPQGRVAIARINRVHARFETVNDDFVYLLSRFVLEPNVWNRRFGWRPLCAQERLALFFFWQEVGRRMNIRHIPPTYAELEQFSRDFERDECRPASTNHRLYLAVREVLAGWISPVLRPFFRWALPCMLDEALRKNLMLPSPSPIAQATVTGLLRVRARAASWLPSRR